MNSGSSTLSQLSPDFFAGGDGCNLLSFIPKHEQVFYVLNPECEDTVFQHSWANGQKMQYITDIEVLPVTSQPLPFIDHQIVSKHGSTGHGEEMGVQIIKPTTIHKYKKPSESKDAKIAKYKFDETYLRFVQNFTNYCEDRSDLIFDGCVFFDDEFFPRSMILKDYVPINVNASFVENVLLQVPSSSEYCKFAPCGSTLYDCFEDYKAFSNRECILRNQVIFILRSLQCPKLTTLEIDSTPVDETSTTRYSTDRLSVWHDTISSFISRHAKTLRYIQMNIIRYKCLDGAQPFAKADNQSSPKGSFPNLYELSVTIWDNEVTSSKYSSDSESDKAANRNVWIPDWIPDPADQYWISLMKSQVHGFLTKICWISPAKLDWNDVFQPLLNANRNSLECIQIIEIEGMLNRKKTENSLVTETKMGCESRSVSTSNLILNCIAFSKLRRLKSLSLRKINCHLTHLNMLPPSIEELSMDDISIRSTEIATLSFFPRLKILRLANSAPTSHGQSESDTERFGVSKVVLNALLHTRSLNELFVLNHRLGLDMDVSSTHSICNVTTVVEKINSYLVNICKSSYKISPSKFCEWNMEQLREDKKLLKSLEELGFIDEECIVIHEQK